MWGCSSPPTDPGLTPEEIAQLDAAFNEYAALREAYEKVLSLEFDHDRIKLVESALESLNEDNK